ncbi:MAG TPA: cation transporter [Ectothiorhodospiraceae bacterium]|nr:cation transporter [Ectothiorhodospiraceae bacterium]
MAHEHHHEPKNFNRAFAIGVVLNVGFVIIEAFYGFMADSIALIADAGHNFSDVISLLLAWGASHIAGAKPTKRRTYGFRRATIIASVTSAIMLFIALGGITWEALGRFGDPQAVDSSIIIVVAAIGVVINTITALLFISGQKHDLNIRGAYLHMAADAGVSLGVVIAGVAIMTTGWLWLDPVISLLIVAIVLIGTWRLFMDSMNLSLDAAPTDIDVAEIENYLLNLDSVINTHDLHIWALSTRETALTVHLVVNEALIDNHFLEGVTQELHDRYSIEHATIQIENRASSGSCRLDRPECI